jgi:hypothetical protein
MLEWVQVEPRDVEGYTIQRQHHALRWPLSHQGHWSSHPLLAGMRIVRCCRRGHAHRSNCRWSAGQDGVGAGDSAAVRWPECGTQHEISGLPSFEKGATRTGCIRRQSKCCACARRQLGWKWPARGSRGSAVRHTYRRARNGGARRCVQVLHTIAEAIKGEFVTTADVVEMSSWRRGWRRADQRGGRRLWLSRVRSTQRVVVLEKSSKRNSWRA